VATKASRPSAPNDALFWSKFILGEKEKGE
jgi:hypothetical protein